MLHFNPAPSFQMTQNANSLKVQVNLNNIYVCLLICFSHLQRLVKIGKDFSEKTCNNDSQNI
jgi:hypothetical protein